MKFSEIVEQARALLQRTGKVTYGVLKREFALDEEGRRSVAGDRRPGEERGAETKVEPTREGAHACLPLHEVPGAGRAAPGVCRGKAESSARGSRWEADRALRGSSHSPKEGEHHRESARTVTRASGAPPSHLRPAYPSAIHLDAPQAVPIESPRGDYNANSYTRRVRSAVDQ